MPTLRDDVLSRVQPVKRHTAWWQTLPADVLAEIVAIRKQFRAGELGRVDATSLARAIVESLEARGLTMPRPKQVQLWLNEKLRTT